MKKTVFILVLGYFWACKHLNGKKNKFVLLKLKCIKKKNLKNDKTKISHYKEFFLHPYIKKKNQGHFENSRRWTMTNIPLLQILVDILYSMESQHSAMKLEANLLLKNTWVMSFDFKITFEWECELLMELW